MPAATFILMAAEAARQIFVAEELIAGSIEMFRFSFHGPLSLSLLDTAPGLELHLIAQLTDQANHFNFHILYLLSGKKDRSERLCSGSFRWTDTLTKKGGNSPHPLDCDNDPWLLKHSQVLGYSFSPSIFDLRLNSRSSSGAFECLSDPFDHSWVDPGTLHSILELASISNIQYSPPSVQHIASIASLTFPLLPKIRQKNGRFTTEVRSTSLSMMKVNIGISSDEHCGISFAEICFANDKVIEQAPASRSLFFNPVILPDITRLRPSATPMDLSECLRLVTHKWPMSDVAITGLMDQDTQSVLDSVRAASCGGRSHFRSITIVGNAELDLASSKIRYAEKLGANHRFHLLFQGMDQTAFEESCNQVLPGGIFSVRMVSEEQSNRPCQSFTKLCNLTGFKDRHVWSIWRRHEISHSEQQCVLNSRLTLFGSDANFTLFGDAFPGAQRVLLAPTAMKTFSDLRRSSTEKSDAIIFDYVESSIITTWTGTELVPWLQVLLTFYENIIWVTLESWNRSPHHGVAGNLLRSLQAEQPSLRTAWLMFEDLPVAEIPKMISSVYQDLKAGRGENEVVLEVTNSGSKILRYLPDDRLSVSAGVALPRNEVKSDLAGSVYEISFARPAPIALVWNEYVRKPLDNDKVRVNIEASVLDVIDVLGLQSTAKFNPLPCRFFAGQVLDSGKTKFATGTRVVGWYEGQHRSQADVPSSCLHSYNASSSPATSATKFASLCIALCILDGAARARKGDTFNIRLEGFLGEAVTKLCTDFGADSFMADGEGSATFTVQCSLDRGLVINNTTLGVEGYLGSTRGSDMLSHHWNDAGPQELLPKAIKLSEIQQHLPRLEPLDTYSTVVDHSDTDNAKGVIVNRRSGALFSNQGTYVVVGGLGGLGRFVCSWMVENGATRLVVISRNGLRSQEAKETYSAIRSSGASMEVMKADACDRAAMQEVLAQIRRDSPVKGVLNLAMVLEDSQFASMTGEQWDGAVGLKQKSSWILHEETITDQLDFFILFSSIASVLGNRGQGNYNVGNTFLNALARYRRFIGLTAVSIALGAMSEFLNM
jgi:KR domain